MFFAGFGFYGGFECCYKMREEFWFGGIYYIGTSARPKIGLQPEHQAHALQKEKEREGESERKQREGERERERDREKERERERELERGRRRGRGGRREQKEIRKMIKLTYSAICKLFRPIQVSCRWVWASFYALWLHVAKLSFSAVLEISNNKPVHFSERIFQITQLLGIGAGTAGSTATLRLRLTAVSLDLERRVEEII